MSYAERHTVHVTTDAAGDAVAWTALPVTGEIVSVVYQRAAEAAFADTADVSVSLEASGVPLWEESNVMASKTVSPMQPAHSQAGAALLYEDQGEPVTRPIYAAMERVRVEVTEAGAERHGTFVVVVA